MCVCAKIKATTIYQLHFQSLVFRITLYALLHICGYVFNGIMNAKSLEIEPQALGLLNTKPSFYCQAFTELKKR